MFSDGALYVPGAETIIPNIELLVGECRRQEKVLLSSADAHSFDDAEMQQWPPHCIKGTKGAELIPQVSLPNRLVVPNAVDFAIPPDLSRFEQILIEKNTLDVFDNPHTAVLLSRLFPIPHLVEVVVFGVATEFCVQFVVNGLLQRRYHVLLVIDAICPISTEEGNRVVADFRARGVTVATTHDLLQRLTMTKAA